MTTNSRDQHTIAETLRRQAVARLNADISPATSDQAGPANGDVMADTDSRLPLPDWPDEAFHSSQNSQLAKTRRWIWISVAFGTLVALAGSKGSPGGMAFTIGLSLALAVAIDLFLRRQMVTDTPAVTLTKDGIASRLFTGKTKQYAWPSIAGVAFESNQNARLLRLLLDPALALPDRRDFLTGANAARPAIPLNSFEPAVQEELYAAINRRVARADSSNASAPANPLAEEREFQERLKSLAPTPWLTYGLIAVNILIWAITVALGAGIMTVPTEKLLLWGGNSASEVQRGEWWRLLSAMFLHSGLMHLLMNMIGLASAGITVERIYGRRLFVLLYIGSGLLGSALSLHFAAQHAVSVGASGAVFGITGALLVGIFQHRKNLPANFAKQTASSLGVFILYSLLQGLSRQGIDNAAHIGGLVGGCLLAYLLPERFDLEHFARTFKQRAIAGVTITALATTTLAATAPAAEIDHRRLFAGQAAFMRAIAEFDAAIKAMQADQQNVASSKLTAREADERSRTLLAPMMRQAVQDFAAADLLPSDPRAPLLKESKRMTELLLESLEMQSVYPAGSDKPEPVDPVRMAAIENEIKEVGGRLEKIVRDTQAKKGKR